MCVVPNCHLRLNSLLPYKGILFGIQTKYVSARRNEQYFTVLLKHMQIHIRAKFS